MNSSFGYNQFEVLANTFHDMKVRYYSLVKKVSRATKEDPNKFIYIIELHIPDHESCLRFNPDKEITSDWRPTPVF